ncbi:MAG: FecR domain-containing protein [Acidobacteria bacterium]|nr:FecR domain-containing protein [Acidobacteriota bacterium]
MNDEQPHDYLWDGTGPPDPDVAHLENLLRPLAHRGSPPAWPPRKRPGAYRVMAFARPALAIAAAALLAVSVWFGWGMWRGGWSVQTVTGMPVLDGVSMGEDGLLQRGGRLVTDGASRARISVGRIGRVDVDPDTRLRLINTGGRDHRLSLERGTIHAQISAPPRFFFVDTPSAVAIDLGCAYTLQVDDAGAGLLRVTHGWVQFAFDGRTAFIPQGAVGATRPGVGPGTPRYEDAPSGFAEALAVLDFGEMNDPKRDRALALILATSRRRDALTLWHLLSRGSPGERQRVYDQLARLSPAPSEVTRDAVLAGDQRALNAWWDSFRFEGTSWWDRVKKKARS